MLNGYELVAPEDDTYNLVISVARGETQKTDVIEFFRRHVTRGLP